MVSAMGSARVQGPVFPLIGPEELAGAVAGDHRPVVLDVRWTLTGADRDAYLAGHLPGAVFVDLDAQLAGPAGLGGRHPIPDPAALQLLWRTAGIDGDADVVVYDGSDSSAAARGWWLLRWSGVAGARVLDGGLAEWRAAGLPVVAGPEALPPEGSVVVHPGGMPTISADDIGGPAGPEVLLDARAAARFRGEVEPVDPVAGHIPGAVNLPYLGLLDERRRFRPPSELAAAFGASGIGPGMAAAASCGSGVTACVLVLAAATIGVELALYPGSYSQWCALGREVATG
jgi:thiosulfate/3-mercaptopyruvate sulfurtransferase